MGNFLNKVRNTKKSRKNFLEAIAAIGASNRSNSLVQDTAKASSKNAKWVSAACWHNCGGRCINMALVQDGVVLRQKTDDTHPDSWDYPQQRSCLRGRSQQQQCLGPDRIKYPMKRKHWEPLTGGKKELRGRDEWERITWEEALDYVAAEFKHAKEKYGNRSFLIPNYTVGEGGRLLGAYGGYIRAGDTSSFGTFCLASKYIGTPNWGKLWGNDRYDLVNADTIILYGSNPVWSSAGSPSWHYWQAKEAGVQFVVVGPEYNVTAALLEAKWIRVRPGTDTAFLLGVIHTMLEEDDPQTNPIIDWDFLHKYCVGFDAESMPADAKLNENLMDYVLGKYDGLPKTAEWASEICGAPVNDIKWYAREMRKDKKVSTHHGYGAARCNDADDWPQLIIAVSAMGGQFGKPGRCCAGTNTAASASGGPGLVRQGETGLKVFDNIAKSTNEVDDVINVNQIWEAVLGKPFNHTGNGIGLEFAPGQTRQADIHVIYHENNAGFQSIPGVMKGIEAHRHVDFVVAHAYNFTTQAKYSDIVLPIITQWEAIGGVLGGILPSGQTRANREFINVYSQVIPPLYEAKSDQWIAKELAKRLGIDPDELYPIDEKQQFFNAIASTTCIAEDGVTSVPVATITEADIAEWGVEGTPQEGRIGIKELIEQGGYQVERHPGDNHIFIGYQEFIEDPEKHPLSSKSGKFEIYCQQKADMLNSLGYNNKQVWKPYPTYRAPLDGYESTFSDWEKKIKGEYPYQMYTPHYLRRSHTVFDNTPWTREAMTNPVFINAKDAAEKGIKQGDTVLVWTPYGKVLRHASVSQRLMPGCISLPHGSWVELDEKSGIDLAGSENVLMGWGRVSGQGTSGYNTVVANFKKYDGKPLKPDWEWPQRIVKLD